MVGDFTNFFDNLDHTYLKKQLCTVSNQNTLTPPQYKIFKNITKYSYLDIQDIATFLNIPQKKLTTLRPSLSSSSLHSLKKLYLKHNKDENQKWKSFGIPQGSPISAIFANIYMIQFDEQLNSFTQKYNGLYRRYSDDFVIIIPNIALEEFSSVATQIMEIVSPIPNLVLENHKTAFYKYSGNMLDSINNVLPDQENDSKLLNFLGFSFDGKNITIRDKTITKYYYKLYSNIDRQLRLEIKREYCNIKNRKDVKYRRTAIIKKKSKLGAKVVNGKGTNFISYVKKCTKVFPSEQKIWKIKESNLDKISKRFNAKSKMLKKLSKH